LLDELRRVFRSGGDGVLEAPQFVGVISLSPSSESRSCSWELLKKRWRTWRTSERLASCSATQGL